MDVIDHRFSTWADKTLRRTHEPLPFVAGMIYLGLTDDSSNQRVRKLDLDTIEPMANLGQSTFMSCQTTCQILNPANAQYHSISYGNRTKRGIKRYKETSLRISAFKKQFWSPGTNIKAPQHVATALRATEWARSRLKRKDKGGVTSTLPGKYCSKTWGCRDF